MQEQLRHKNKFNIIRFDTKAVAWKDRACDVTEQHLLNAWNWVKGGFAQNIFHYQFYSHIFLLTKTDKMLKSFFTEFDLSTSIRFQDIVVQSYRISPLELTLKMKC